MFDATLGRFLQRDPIGFAHGNPRVTGGLLWVLNLYVYALDRPSGLGDFDGLKEIDVLAVPSDDATLQKERDRVKRREGYTEFEQKGDLSDLIESLNDKAEDECDCIRSLEIDAHGGPNSIDGINSSNLRSVGERLKKDVRWCGPCFIYLAGCNTGLGQMAQTLANDTGCTVSGSLGYLSGTHAEGNEEIKREIDYNGRHYGPVPGSMDASGRDSWQAFQPGGQVPAANPALAGKDKKGK
jgi:hypothetical protein